MGLASEEPGKCTRFRDYLHLRGHLRYLRPRRVELATMVQRRRTRRIRPNIDVLLSHSDGEIVSYLWVRVSASSSYTSLLLSRFTFPFDFSFSNTWSVRSLSVNVVLPIYIRFMCLSDRVRRASMFPHVLICEGTRRVGFVEFIVY
jgi:hypothetical protein